MNRLERVREEVDAILHRVVDEEDRRCGFVHLYGVSLTATHLALQRGIDAELAAVAGMMHDLATYETGDLEDHAPRSAVRAVEILRSIGAFTETEIEAVRSAIAHHSEKGSVEGPFEELLKDADVLQHLLCNPELEPPPRHEARAAALRFLEGDASRTEPTA